MKKTNNIARMAVGVLAALLLLGACATLPTASSVGRLSGPLVSTGFPQESQLSAYAKEGLSGLSTFQLANGIPVVVRRNAASPVRNLTLVIRGGATAATPATAGYESLALNVMARASAKYSYDDIQALLDETSASMGPGTNLEYSTYSLTALDKYFGKLLPVWADTLMAPAFSQEDFDQVLSQAKLAVQSKEKDPWQRTGVVMNAAFFSGHPYAPAPEGTKDSLAAATLDAVKAWYAKSFSADRIFIVASGDFDAAALKKDLDAAIGALPDRKAGVPALAPRFSLAGTGSLIKVEHPSAKSIAFVRGDFAAPAPGDADYMAANIAFKMYSDLLFSVVRDEHGAVYTPSAYIRSFGANYGSIVMYKTNVPGKIKAYIDEATAQFAAGKILSPDASEDGSAPRMSVEEGLAMYKAQFANEYFEKLQTNSAVSGLIAQSVITTGDCRTWLLDAQRIDSVTAAEVKAAAAKYIFGNRITWVVLGTKENLATVSDADFQAFKM